MSKCIVLIERSSTLQVLLSAAFRQAGHQVIVQSTPQDALALLAALNNVPPDLIFLAMEDEKKAYTLIEYVKNQAAYASTSLVAIVQREEKARIQRALGRANVHYLVKPFQIQRVLALVSGAMHSPATPEKREEII